MRSVRTEINSCDSLSRPPSHYFRPSAKRWLLVRMRRSEFLALIASATAATAIAIDSMLPAFGSVRDHFDLGSNPADVALVVTVFMIGLGVGQVIYGPLSDRFGRKRVFAAGLVLYMAAGLAATLSPTFGLLLVARFVWGLGSAGPRVVSQAILRDRFSGDELARAMAVIVTIFLIVPTVAPLIGQLVLSFGSWRYTFAVGPVFAAIVLLWSSRLEESHPVNMRRSLAPRQLLGALMIVLRTPSALGGMIALTALTAAFLPYLGSSERMFDLIYGRGDQFFLWFALAAAVMAMFTLASGRIVKRSGVKRTLIGWLVGLVVLSALYLAMTLANEGVPPFSVFFVMTTLVIAMNTAATPLLTSSALNEVGHVAGTAASTIGAVSLLGGSMLAQLVDRAVGETITPFVVGYLIAAVVALFAAWQGLAKREVAGV